MLKLISKKALDALKRELDNKHAVILLQARTIQRLEKDNKHLRPLFADLERKC